MIDEGQLATLAAIRAGQGLFDRFSRLTLLEEQEPDRNGDEEYSRFYGEALMHDPSPDEMQPPARSDSEIEELVRERELYQEIFRSMPSGCLDFDARGYIERLNQTAAAFLGQPEESLRGKSFLPFISSKDLQRFVIHLRGCFEDNISHGLELKLRPRDGERLTVQIWSVGVDDPEKGARICRTTLTDITDRKLSEEALHESKECFRVMSDSTPVLLWMSDGSGQFTYVNKTWIDYTGRELQEELGSGWTDQVHPDDVQSCLDYFHMALRDRERFCFEYRLRGREGNYRWFMNTGVPRSTPSGEVAGFLGSCVDITERKEAEELRRHILEDFEILVQERTANLKAINSKLRREVAARKRLEKQIVEITDSERRRIGNDLHDGLGQELTGVAFLTKVLEQKLRAKNRPEVAEAAQIHKFVSQALMHTRELARGLHVVELEAGGLPSALEELSNQVEHLFNITCEVKCDKSIRISDPAVATHVFRIAQEALNNAVKHGSAKRVSIQLVKQGGKVALTVRDNGTGVPDSGPSRSGIGLHTMRYRSEMIRGTFDIQRMPEGGTVATCLFPIKTPKRLQS